MLSLNFCVFFLIFLHNIEKYFSHNLIWKCYPFKTLRNIHISRVFVLRQQVSQPSIFTQWSHLEKHVNIKRFQVIRKQNLCCFKHQVLLICFKHRFMVKSWHTQYVQGEWSNQIFICKISWAIGIFVIVNID